MTLHKEYKQLLLSLLNTQKKKRFNNDSKNYS